MQKGESGRFIRINHMVMDALRHSSAYGFSQVGEKGRKMFIAILRDGQTELNAIKFPSPEVEAPKMIINSPPPTPRRPKILFPLPRHIFHVPLNPFLAALWALLKETQLDLIIIESNSRERTEEGGREAL
jgi:hypothetical protein